MDATKLGSLLGAVVLEGADRDLAEAHTAVGRNRLATHFSLHIAYAWACQLALELAYRDPDKPDVIRHMLGVVVTRLRELTGLKDGSLIRLVENRLEGFARAASDEHGYMVLNLAKYLTACSESMNAIIDYDRMIPDPDELDLVADSCDPVALAKLKRLKTQQSLPTYRMNLTGQIGIGMRIVSVAEGAKQALCALA